MRLPVRGLAVLLLVATALLLPATPAAAHGQLAMSDPIADSTVSQPMADVTLYFTETPASYAWFTITAPSGRRVDNGWRTGQPKRLDKPVTEYYLVDGKYEPRVYNTGYSVLIGVAHWPEPGAYVAAFQSIASDGEAVKGTLKFTYSGPVTQPPAGWTNPTGGPPDALTRALAGQTAAPTGATPAPTPGLLGDAGSAPAAAAPPAAAPTAPSAPFVLTDWLIPAGIIVVVGLVVVSAARRAPVQSAKKRRRATAAR